MRASGSLGGSRNPLLQESSPDSTKRFGLSADTMAESFGGRINSGMGRSAHYQGGRPSTPGKYQNSGPPRHSSSSAAILSSSSPGSSASSGWVSRDTSRPPQSSGNSNQGSHSSLERVRQYLT